MPENKRPRRGVAAVATLATCVAALALTGTTAAQAVSDQDVRSTTRAVERDQVLTTRVESYQVVPGGTSIGADVVCPAGYVPTDGGFLLDAVDNGDLSSVFVLESYATASGWHVKVRNDNDENAQGKLKATCLKLTTAASDGHTHGIQLGSAANATGSATWGFDLEDDPSHDFVLGCDTGETPIAPSWAFSSGSGVVREGYATGSTYTFVIDANELSTANVSVQCLRSQLTAAQGHTPSLTFTSVAQNLSVPAYATSEGVLACQDAGSGIVGSYRDTDAGLRFLGVDPRGGNRMFRFLNDVEEAGSVSLGLTCLADKTAVPPPAPVNEITLGASGTRKHVGTNKAAVVVTITCTKACTITGRLSSGSTSLAYGKATLGAGQTRLVKLPVKSAQRSNIQLYSSAKLVVTSGSVSTSRTITLN